MKNIGIIGGSKASEYALKLAYESGKEIAKRDWVLYCGGGRGIMAAASKGAYELGGTVIGILPGFTRDGENPYLSYVVPTGLGHLRNQIIICSSDYILAFEGSVGTLSEIAFANLYNKPVISLGSWKLPPDPFFKKSLFEAEFQSVESAIQWIEKNNF